MKIGIMGAGNVGRSVGGLLAGAGHEVRYGSRRPAAADQVVGLEDAAAFAEVMFCATPYGVWPELARTLAPHAAGKVVIDAANPYPQRDGKFAQDAIDAGRGSGPPIAALLPGARLVRAFNCVPWPGTAAEAHRAWDRIAIPLAGDDPDARAVTAGLIRDAGFDPVDAGPLVEARRFDPGEPAYNRPMPAEAMRAALARS